MDKASLSQLIERANATGFTPYGDYSEEADAFNVRFLPDADYTERLTDHVTLFRSFENDRIVGCRIKGISAILEDLPNFVHVDDGPNQLLLVFWSFRGGLEGEEARTAFKELFELAQKDGDKVKLQEA
ncbi:MAG: hypothetical protein MPJ50_05350 [Pirellulales bacterium]|nr:hypothetical protein [Pirellulales bacterium]